MEKTSPVALVKYAPTWPAQFESIKRQLAAIFPAPTHMIEHIGSTAVRGMSAKPVIDIMLGAPGLTEIEAKLDALTAIGFYYVVEFNAAMPMRRYFVWPESYPREVHLHAVVCGEKFWCDHLLFRDSLRQNAELAQAYEALKHELAARFSADSFAYADAKTAFIQNALNHARMPAKQ